MSARPFAHLHCHTHYSLLDGANRVPDLVKQIKSLGMNSCAITDHGNLYGALEFYQQCRANDVNPILGYEAYIAPGHRTDRSATRMKEAAYHLTLLAMNRTGFHNLIKMASKAYLEGFYYRPRIDKELLEAHHEGIICLSGCASSELSRLLLADDNDKAKQLIHWYSKLFGDRFYLEIQDGGVEIQQSCAAATIDVANQMGLPLVATNDAHYLCQDDAETHDVLLCVNTKAYRSDQNRMKIQTDQLFIRSPEQMYAAFPNVAEAVARSQEIADRCDIQLDLKTRHFPVFLPPEQKTDVQYLREVAEEGFRTRYGENPDPTYIDRLNYELGVIDRMGYSSYFLIVWDFARFATSKGIPCTARGSACGAMVSFVLGLSDVCPMKYDLLFERFLDPSRSEAPDIDIDFCRDRRELVINYVKEKYGHANVAQIGTFGTLKAKAAIRDVARALSIPLKRADEIAKMVPETLNIKLKDALKASPELNEAYEGDPQVKELITFAIGLEGLAKSAGTHAAGVVIGDKPLDEYIPLQRISGKEDVLTQWTDVETAGLLKMDFLGLRNLSILDKAVANVKKHRGISIVPRDLPLDDQETFALLQRGETKGIFQLESGGMRDLLTKMKPDKFADIIATSALYRPGPLEGGMVMTYVNVKHGREPVPTVHPIVDDVLAETYGVMVYQEQVMRILNRLGGIELADSYKCIKAISKKKQDIMLRYLEKFLEGAQTQGMSKDQAQDIWNLIEKFAGYGFNKCLTGDTQVLIDVYGLWTSIDRIREEIASGREVFVGSRDSRSGECIHRRVVAVHENGIKPVMRIKIGSGRQEHTLTGTLNHLILAEVDRGKIGWRPMHALRTGDRVCVRNLSRPDSKHAPFAGQVRSRDFILEPVEVFEPTGEELPTYDLEVEAYVEDDHNFVAEGFAVHNSHSTAYGAIAYQTAYLKAHYPEEFMAALLSCGMESSERIFEHTDDCRRMGIEILPPDVNTSTVEFGVVVLDEKSGDGSKDSAQRKISFGMGAIKGVGEAAMQAIVDEREANGRFQDIFDLCERVDPKQLTKGVLETLTKAGALDSFGPTRAQHMLVIDRAVQGAASKQRDKARGQKSLFGDDSSPGDAANGVPETASVPPAEPWTHGQTLAYEKEVFGFYLTSHPLTEFAEQIESFTQHTTKDLRDAGDGKEVVLGGMISSIKKATTKNPSRNGNSKYVNFDLEDAAGVVRCIMWPDDFANEGEKIKQDSIVIVKGRADVRGREPNLILNKVMTLEEAEKEFTKQISIHLQRGLHSEMDMKRVKEILSRFPGKTPVWVILDHVEEYRPGPNGNGNGNGHAADTNGDAASPPARLRAVMTTPFNVSARPELKRELMSVLGEKGCRFRASPTSDS